KAIPTYFDHIDRVVARDDFTVVFEFGEFNAEWDYRFGYGYFSGIGPRELADVDPKDWRNVTGTGPFSLERFIPGNSQTYARRPDYWDRTTIGGQIYEIPFIDKLTYRTIKDEATYLTAIRTGKLDILEYIRWIAVDHLKKTTPELRWSRLLAEAGYPDGFTFRMQVSANNAMRMELAPLLASYLDRIGVTIEIEVVEYAAYLSMMTTRTHGPGYLMASGHVNPTTTLRKNFVTGQTWNPSMWSDPELDRRIHEMFLTRDEAERQRIVKQITKEMLDEAPYLWLPVPYIYTAWWPWVKNYGGELRAGAVRPGPIYARLWIDQEMKREMGF
ncbi:MAG: ABC transporter substrate-binding protein, partial [Acidobacteriota bacterium]|nr:ABC transporter substrate-binding protein [Acidobacteriota bacterium]